jgi:hypothetical protein
LALLNSGRALKDRLVLKLGRHFNGGFRSVKEVTGLGKGGETGPGRRYSTAPRRRRAPISWINIAMIMALIVMVVFALWRVNKTLRQTSADENAYRSRLRRSIYQFALWAGVGLAAVAAYSLLIAPTPMPSMWTYLLSFVGAYAVLAIICAGVYALVRRH